MSKLVLGDGVWVINLVTQDDEWHLLELFHGEEGIKFSLGLGQALVVLGIDKEDNAGDLWEVVLP